MYKGRSGMWSWLLHRVTGLGILLFLLIHIVDISLLGFGPRVYDEGIALFDNVIVRFLSLAIVGAVLLHAFNGVRVMLITVKSVLLDSGVDDGIFERAATPSAPLAR